MKAEDFQLWAEVVLASAAIDTVAAGKARVDVHPLPQVALLGAFVLDYLSDDFVAQDPGQAQIPLSLVEGLHVCSADTTSEYFN